MPFSCSNKSTLHRNNQHSATSSSSDTRLHPSAPSSTADARLTTQLHTLNAPEPCRPSMLGPRPCSRDAGSDKPHGKPTDPQTPPLARKHPRRPARPETHQNLIHISKEHPATRGHGARGRRSINPIHDNRRRKPRALPWTRSGQRSQTRIHMMAFQARSLRRGLGQSPILASAYGGGRDRTDDLLLAKQALSQLSYAPQTVVSRQSSAIRNSF